MADRPARRIAQRIASGEVLVGDGAWGTQLMARGFETGQCPELWCLDRRDDVLERVPENPVAHRVPTLLSDGPSVEGAEGDESAGTGQLGQVRALDVYPSGRGLGQHGRVTRTWGVGVLRDVVGRQR